MSYKTLNYDEAMEYLDSKSIDKSIYDKMKETIKYFTTKVKRPVTKKSIDDDIEVLQLEKEGKENEAIIRDALSIAENANLWLKSQGIIK